MFIEKKVLSTIFIISIVSVGLIDFWLINIPAKSINYYKAGQIWYKISFAYITSYIFFFLNVQIANFENKSKNFPHIVQKSALIFLKKEYLIMAIQYHSGVTAKEYFNNKDTDFEKWCSNIKTFANVKAGSSGDTYSNWEEYLKNLREETKYIVSDLLTNADLLSKDTRESLLSFSTFLDLQLNPKMKLFTKEETMKNNAYLLKTYIDNCEKIQLEIDKDKDKYTY